jgi:AraC-like DNA-binding protein
MPSVIAMHQSIVPQSYAGLRRWRYFELDSVEEAQARITGVLHPHKLIPGRQLRNARYRMDFLPLSGHGFAAINHGGAMHVDSLGSNDDYLLLFCPSGTGVVQYGGEEFELSGRLGFAYNPGQSFQARFSEQNEQFVIKLSAEVVGRHSDGGLPILKPQVDLDAPAMQPWLAMVRALLSSPGMLDLARSKRMIAANLEDLLTLLLLEGHPHQEQTLRRSVALAPATVRRSEEFIRQNAAKPLNLAMIAAAVDVPQRTLLEAFRRFRDTSPMKFVRDVRLDAVRRRLANGDAPCTVAEAAVEFGFGHLSRFSQEYRRRFGEKPSETVARSQPRRSLS